MKILRTKPFLKWAGGKTQLIGEIEKYFDRSSQNFRIYVEPFVGSGAVLLHVLEKYPDIQYAVINDINPELMNCFEVIRDNPADLINLLMEWEKEYNKHTPESEERKEIYYTKRTLFNQKPADIIRKAALFIFLNKTCFNGLYRVNKKGEFNVPQGRYSNPGICNPVNIMKISTLLEKVTIFTGDYAETVKYSSKDSFFYLDPPYKPLSQTSNFTSYSSSKFDDNEQVRLKQFCDILEKNGATWVLSNSDAKDSEGKSYFAESLYSDRQVKHVLARRNINSSGAKRGKVKELLISNF